MAGQDTTARGQGRAVTPTISTHVLDTETGQPASGRARPRRRVLADGATPARGIRHDRRRRSHPTRCSRAPWSPASTASPSRSTSTAPRCFYREVSLEVNIEDTARSYHVPLLVAPFGDQLVPGQLSVAATPRRRGSATFSSSADLPPTLAFADLRRSPLRARAALHRAAGRRVGRSDRGTALFERPLAIALAMPRDEQLELIDAHPRIGAPPGSVSAHSFVEQGYDRETAAAEAEVERERIAADLARLNDAYEARFGFRYVIFVAGRPRAAIVPLLAAALRADPDAERERAIRDVVAIARDRAAQGGLRLRDIEGRRATRWPASGGDGSEAGDALRQGGGLDLPDVGQAARGPDAHPRVGLHGSAQPPAGSRDRRPGHGRRVRRGLHPRRQPQRRGHRHDEELHPSTVARLRRRDAGGLAALPRASASSRPTRRWSGSASRARSCASTRCPCRSRTVASSRRACSSGGSATTEAWPRSRSGARTTARSCWVTCAPAASAWSCSRRPAPPSPTSRATSTPRCRRVADRLLFTHVDIAWRYVDARIAVEPDVPRYVATEQVTDLAAVVFHEFVSLSIQHLVHEIGQRMFERFEALAEVDLRGAEPHLRHGRGVRRRGARKVYTDPRPPYGRIGLDDAPRVAALIRGPGTG